MSKNLTIIMAFMIGYIVSDLVDNLNGSLVSPAYAEVGGKDASALLDDYDFTSAVESHLYTNSVAIYDIARIVFREEMQKCGISGYDISYLSINCMNF